MRIAAGVITFLVSAGAALANPIVTDDDSKSYQLQMDCTHISAGLQVNPGQTVQLDSFEVGKSCKINVFPVDNPYGKDGNYDPKKRISSAKLKRDSECVIKKGRVVCE